jgi:hypothetical protein
MAQTAITQPSRLTPSPKALQKALEHSAKQAQRLADAYGRGGAGHQKKNAQQFPCCGLMAGTARASRDMNKNSL